MPLQSSQVILPSGPNLPVRLWPSMEATAPMRCISSLTREETARRSMEYGAMKAFALTGIRAAPWVLLLVAVM